MSGAEVILSLLIWTLVGCLIAAIGIGVGSLFGEAYWGGVIGAFVGFLGWWLFAGIYLSVWERRGGAT